ncbi:MAG: CoA transferase [Myxococcota bacterium]
MGALDGLRVLELSRSAAGVQLGMLLADHGADVLRIDLGGPTRSAGPVWLRGRPARAMDLASADDQRRLQSLADRADVVIDDLPAGGWAPALPATAIRVRTPVSRGRYDLVGFDGPAAAAGGGYAAPLSRKPDYSPLALASTVTALYAAVGVAAALLARQRDGRGQDLFIAQEDAVLSVHELTALLSVRSPTRWSPVQWAASPFIRAWSGADGREVFVHAGMPKHAARLIEILKGAHADAMTGLDLDAQTRDDPSAVASPTMARRIVQAFSDVFQTKTAAEWEAVLSAAGVCAVVVRSDEEWLAHPHPLAAGLLVEVDGIRQPGVHVQLQKTPGQARPAPDEHAFLWRGTSPWHVPLKPAVTEPPLAGISVVDVTQVIAGPTAARTLAELGATVLRIENPTLNVAWVEPFHVAYNAGKQSTFLDLSAEQGKDTFAKILKDRAVDVLVENFRPGVAERMGLSQGLGEDAVVLSMSAYGSRGPWGDRPGWEQTAQAASGIMRQHDGLMPLPINDFATGLSGAFGVLLALVHRARGGGGQRVETALAGTATLLQAPYLWTGAPRPPDKGEMGQGSHRRFYRARDGWCFLEAAPGALDGVDGFPDQVGDADAIQEALRFESVHTWQNRFAGRDAVIMPWRSARKALTDPTHRARGTVFQEAVEGVGLVTRTRPALRMSATPLVKLSPAHPRGRDAIDEIPNPQGPDAPHAERNRLAWAWLQARWGLFLARG